jgi:hypothetical protein
VVEDWGWLDRQKAGARGDCVINVLTIEKILLKLEDDSIVQSERLKPILGGQLLLRDYGMVL